MVCAIGSKFSVFSFQDAEFLPAGETNKDYFRQISLGVSLNYSNTTLPPLYAGAKPGALMLTRPPVVFVHGINSGPNVWEGSGNMAGALQSQGYIIEKDSFVDHSISDFGMGPLTTDWSYVQQATQQTLKDFRQGGVGDSTDGSFLKPDSGVFVPTGLAEGTLIAVQKVDVVAHSYGGLLARWYMEQATDSSGGKLFEDFRNIRSLIELGTPNLGSPLANMIDEVYSGTALGNMIASAELDASALTLDVFRLKGIPTTIGGFLGYIKSQGALPATDASGNIYPFYQDDAVDSPLLNQLNAGDPFNTNVGYAAVVGTDYQLPTGNPYIQWLDSYNDFQPMGSSGQSYFPWIETFNGRATDSVVPEWSAALPDKAFDLYVDAPHTKLESNASTEADVVAFLANPTLPLGNAEAAAAVAADPAGQTGWNAPVSDQNAYFGGVNNGPGAEVYDAGLNPEAVVGVQLDGNNDYNAATWKLDVASGNQAGAGIKHPVLTGMVQKSQLENGISMSLAASSGGYDNVRDTMDTATVKYGGTGVYVDANAWAAAGPDDYVPFEISTLEMGRGLTQGVTGPMFGGVQNDGPLGSAMVDYTFGNLRSPTTQVNLPTYTPPALVVVSDNPTGAIQLALSGAFQVTGPTSDSYQVKLYDTNSDLLWEDDVPTTGYTNAWNGLAWSYSLTADLGHNASGQITGPLGSPIASPANILQNFWEDVLPSPLDSTSVEVQ